MSIAYPDYAFVDTAFGGVRSRNHPAPILAVVRKKLQTEGYMTVFRFPPSYVEHCKTTGSVTGWKGKCYADYLPFDIDREGDLEGAWRDAIQLAIHLQDSYEVGSTQIRYYFSGHKGYHLLLPTQLLGEIEPSETLPQEFRTFAARIASEAKVSIDEKIYDMNRLFRLPNTIHATSKLHKIELSYDEFILETPKTHKALAQQTRNIAFLPHDLEINPNLAELFSKPAEKRRQTSSESTNGDSARPTTDASLAKTLSHIFAYAYVSGQRHAVTLALAGYCAKHRIPIQIVNEAIKLLAIGDNEIEDRYTAIQNTYERAAAGHDVRGYRDLEQYLAPGDLAELVHVIEGDKNGRPKQESRDDSREMGSQPDEKQEAALPSDDSPALEWGDDGADWEVEPLVPLIDGLIAKGTFVYLAGETQASKTLFSLFLVGHLIHEQPLFGKFSVSGSSKILYLVLEDPPRRIKDRINDMQRSFTGKHRSGSCSFRFLPLNLVKTDFAKFANFVEPYDVVWLDTYQRATPGIASFDDEKQSAIIHNLATLTRKSGKTVVIVDHVRKSADSKSAGLKRSELSIEDLKGTGTKAQNADTVLLLQKKADGKLVLQSQSKDYESLHLTLMLSKPGSEAPKYSIFDVAELAERQIQRGQNSLEAVFNALPTDGGGLSATAIEFAIGGLLKRAAVRTKLKDLLKSQRIITSGEGPWVRYHRPPVPSSPTVQDEE